MTTKINHEAVLRLLISGNGASNELYYQDKCYDTIRHQYSKLTKSESDKSSFKYARYRMQTDSIEKSHILFERERKVSPRKFVYCD